MKDSDDKSQNANLLDAPRGSLSKLRVASFALLDRIACFFVGKVSNDTLISDLLGPLRVGLVIIFLFFGVFGIWALTAPIEGAIMSMGKVIVDSHRKNIQHLEGGIVEDIFVKDGQEVSKGQPLMKIKNVQARSNKEVITMQIYELLARKERVTAELEGLRDLKFTEEVSGNLSAIAMEDQISLFKARKALFDSQTAILNNRIAQLTNEAFGVLSQIKSSKEQLELLDQESEVVRQLLDQGNTQQSRMLALKKQQVGLEGTISSSEANYSRIQQKIGETELEIITLGNKIYNENINEKKDISQEISKLYEKSKAVNDVVDRFVVIAPQDGVITNLQVYTIGGVVMPGSTLMEIIPTNDNLVIDGRIAAKDIGAIIRNKEINDKSKQDSGFDARVRLVAYNARRVPILNAKVVHLSADTAMDNMNTAQYYSIKVVIEESELENISHSKLYPGMPVEIMITTQSRTLFSYLISPITSSFSKAFRES